MSKRYLWFLLFAAFLFLAGISQVKAATITLTPASGTLSNVIIGNSYNATASTTATSTNASDTYAWSFSGKPAWATVATSTSGTGSSTLTFTVTGTPNATGTVNLAFTATGSSSTATGTGTWSFNVNAATITLTPASGTLSNVIIGNSYNATSSITATSTDPLDTYAWSVSGAPAWATIATTTSGTGSSTLNFTVSGTPNATGTVNLAFKATGANSTATNSSTYMFTVNPATVTLSPASGTLPNVALNSSYSTSSTITATSTNPSDAYTWSVSGKPSWATIATTTSGTGSSTLTFTVSGTPNATGTVSLSFTAAGTSSTSTNSSTFTFDVTLPTPTGLAASAGNGQITVSWNSVSGATLYNLYRSISGAYALLVQTSSTSYVDSGLSNGTTYNYETAATDGSNNTSATSTSVSATPSAPSSGAVVNTGGGASPPPNFTIDNGALITSNPTVEFEMHTTDDIRTMAFATSSTALASSTAVPYSSVLQWNLCGASPSCPPDPYTIYATFFTTAGGTTYQAQQTITLTSVGAASATVTASKQSLQAELNSLLATLKTLEAEAAQKGISMPSVSPSPATFSRNLTFGLRGKDVAALQVFLIDRNSGSFAQKLAAVGASGYFGSLTKGALAEFQTKVGIVPAVGYFGPKTRAYINGVGQ